jgi:hypothetical protein
MKNKELLKRSAVKRSAVKRSAVKRSAVKRSPVKRSPQRFIQRIEFDKYKWNIEEAKSWMSSHRHKYMEMNENKNKYIFVVNPYKSSKKYKTIPVGTNTGIKTVIVAT